MKRKSNGLAIARQWELLKLLPTKGVGITAAMITYRLKEQGFDVSKRTVERDLKELSCQFGLYCNDKSKPYGWRWMDNADFTIPGLSLTDCVSLVVIEEIIRPLLPVPMLRSLQPRFRHAKEKLHELSGENQVARWPDKVQVRNPAMPLLSPAIDERVSDVMHQAILEEKVVTVTYQAVDSAEPKEITLHPLGLVQRGLVSYIVATAFEYTDVRLYAMHRIVEAKQEEASVKKISGFSLQDYVESGAAEFGSGEAVAFKARIHRDIAHLLLETPLSEDMVISGQGEWAIVQATVKDSWQFRWWLLSKGALLEVIEPLEIRDAIGKDISMAAEYYI